MKTSNKLVYFGTEDFSVPALQKLLDGGWPVLAVVTKPDNPAGRGQKVTLPKVKRLAEKYKIPVLQPQNVADVNDQIARLKPDFGVLVAYGKIIPQGTIDLFPGGIINVHPSLLPRYRGPSPIEAAILNGDQQTGISLMRITAGMDEGPVYDQQRVGLAGTETRLELYEKLANLGADFLVGRLLLIIEGKLMPKPQLQSAGTYTQKHKKDDGIMDLGQPAEALERQVRAYAGWPKSHAKIYGQDVVVTKARIAKSEKDGALVIKCQPGYLEIQELVAPSGKTMTGKDFLLGYKK